VVILFVVLKHTIGPRLLCLWRWLIVTVLTCLKRIP